MSLKKDLKTLLAEAEKQGWTVKLAKSGHYKLYAPDGENIVTVGSTPSDRRTLRNTVALMRRYGFKWQGR
jgi:hypothetical protein